MGHKNMKRLFALLLLLTLFVPSPPVVVFAQRGDASAPGGACDATEQEQRAYIDAGAVYFDCEEPPEAVGGGGGGTSGPLVGCDNAEKAWNFFSHPSRNLTPQQVAGILGNLAWESGINPVNIQDPAGESQNPADAGSAGWGLMQWTPGGKIINLMQQAGIRTPVYQLDSQLELVWWHMENTSPTGVANFIIGYRQQTTIEGAVRDFEERMEGAGIPAIERRIPLAQDYFNRFTGGGGCG